VIWAASEEDPGGFGELWGSLLPIGRHPDTGGYRRYAWTDADARCRAWFTDRAAELGLRAETDRNGNLWAWWDQSGDPGDGQDRSAVVTGSHLDSVPDGGAFDGPLGVVSGFAAVRLLRERGARPLRPIAVAAFSDEEGARFGVSCVGSRLATGLLDPDAARALRDPGGVSLADAMAEAGHDPAGIGPDPGRLGRIASFVELHVEQGRALADLDLDAPIAVGTAIWPHGRWRFEFSGAADHAGTTRLPDRRDPMLPFARLVTAARELAGDAGAVATVGRVLVEPNGTNAIPSAVRAWLDARAEREQTVHRLVEDLHAAARSAAAEHGVTVAVRQESWTPEVAFDPALRDRLARLLASPGRDTAPLLPTGAGHDAGILAGSVPTAMLFVRNPTGVSHSPHEHATATDAAAGVHALAAVLDELACR
jgi:N-carbamoyl-L-amino-acid hydrolase